MSGRRPTSCLIFKAAFLAAVGFGRLAVASALLFGRTCGAGWGDRSGWVERHVLIVPGRLLVIAFYGLGRRILSKRRIGGSSAGCYRSMGGLYVMLGFISQCKFILLILSRKESLLSAYLYLVLSIFYMIYYLHPRIIHMKRLPLLPIKIV